MSFMCISCDSAVIRFHILFPDCRERGQFVSSLLLEVLLSVVVTNENVRFNTAAAAANATAGIADICHVICVQVSCICGSYWTLDMTTIDYRFSMVTSLLSVGSGHKLHVWPTRHSNFSSLHLLAMFMLLASAHWPQKNVLPSGSRWRLQRHLYTIHPMCNQKLSPNKFEQCYFH